MNYKLWRKVQSGSNLGIPFLKIPASKMLMKMKTSQIILWSCFLFKQEQKEKQANKPIWVGVVDKAVVKGGRSRGGGGWPLVVWKTEEDRLKQGKRCR